MKWLSVTLILLNFVSKAFSSSSSPESIDTSILGKRNFNLSSQGLDLVVKRSRKLMSDFDPSLSRDEIIEKEANFGSLEIQERTEVLMRALKFIANNDSIGFYDYQTEFVKFMGCEYKGFSRNGIPNYFNVMMILFGCWNFKIPDYIPIINISSDLSGEISNVFKYLFSTQPFDIAMKTVFRFPVIGFGSDERKELENFIKQKYPNLGYFENILIKLIGCEISNRFLTALDILDKEAEVLELLASRLESFCSNHTNFAYYIVMIPLDKPEIFREAKDLVKFSFIKAAIIADDRELLIEMIKIDPSVLNITKYATNIYEVPENVFSAAVKFRAFNCFRHLLTLTIQNSANETYSVAFKEAIKSPISLFIEIVKEVYDINWDTLIKDNGRIMMAIQYAFERGSDDTFNYFIHLAGPINTKAALYKFWGFENEIIKNLLKRFNNLIINQVSLICGIDLNAHVFWNDYGTGNASIFFNNYEREMRCKKLKIKMTN